jgi:hypothetical protein
MELKEYIRMELEGLARGLKKAVDGLKPEEIAWRPACGCNSIGLILYHTLKGEDMFIQGQLKKEKMVWEAGKWYQKLNMDEKEAGAHYTVDQVNAFCPPEFQGLLAYGAAVRAATLTYLDKMPVAEFDKKVKTPFAEMNVAGIFSIIVSHASQHIGEMSYLRGLQRGMDK